MSTRERYERAKSAPSLLVATDFDGTIADITRAPEEAHLRDDARAALEHLASAQGVHLAIVSGRSMDSLHALTSSLGPIYRVAEHGAFITSPSGLSLAPPLDVKPEAIEHLAALATSISKTFPGARVERKSSGVSVHYREADPAHHAPLLAALEPFAKAARDEGLSMMNGRLVLEARARGPSKARALETILAELPPSTFIMYAGDDTTDEAALALAEERGGLGIYIASAERSSPLTPVSVTLESAAAWSKMLSDLAAAR